MEIVGLGYTFWFSYRYLIFKVPPQNELNLELILDCMNSHTN